MARPRAGQPEKYREEYCKTVVEMGKEGKTLVQMACRCGVIPQTLKNWGNDHPEFLAALNLAKAESEAWWTQKALEKATVGGPGSDTMMKFFMSARFGWSDKTEVKTDVTSGGEKLAVGPLVLAPADAPDDEA